MLHHFHRQRYTFQRDSLDFRYRERRHLLFLFFREQLVANTWTRTTCTTPTLLSGRTRNPLLHEPREPVLWVELGLLHFATVDHVDDVVDGDRRLQVFCELRVLTEREGHCTSATLVAAIIFHWGVGANTARCSSLERFACKGNILELGIPRRVSMHWRISCTPGRNISIPAGLSAVVTMCFTMAATSYVAVSLRWKLRKSQQVDIPQSLFYPIC